MGLILQNGAEFSAENRKYRIVSFLGRGSTAICYLAECIVGRLSAKCILKEFAPEGLEPERNIDYSLSFTNGYVPDSEMADFIASGKRQNDIRQMTNLCNQTPPVSRTFYANSTAYIEIVCFGGNTLDKINNLSLKQYIEICETISETVMYYHNNGFICLDLKPENIFILQNSADSVITQLVEFIDFDSIRTKEETEKGITAGYTEAWASSEQLLPYTYAAVSEASDIYTLGELVFWIIFGRHSDESEHRGFSKYPFDKCRKEFRKACIRPEIQRLFIRLFRNTIRSSPSNRFNSAQKVNQLLHEISSELSKELYFIPKIPYVTPNVVGRKQELTQIKEMLSEKNVLFLNGIGGIGKTVIAKTYIELNKSEYDTVIYIEYDNDIKTAFCDDNQLQISTVRKEADESISDYFIRKLSIVREICTDKKVLFVLDNFTGKMNKELSILIDCGFDTIIVSRQNPPENSFNYLTVNAISDETELFKLISVNLERGLTKEERNCFSEIIHITQGHTLVLELAARQIKNERLSVNEALKLIRNCGINNFSEAYIRNYKDGTETEGTLKAIISALFSTIQLSGMYINIMKLMSLMRVRGLEIELADLVFDNLDDVKALSESGWCSYDERIYLHPVIAETAREWAWSKELADEEILEYHQKLIDVYVGFGDTEQLINIIRSSEYIAHNSSRHCIKAMYYNQIAWYYDSLIDGAYIPETEEEVEIVQNLIDYSELAIEEMEQSDLPDKDKHLTNYYISLANILLRSSPDFHSEAGEILDTIMRELSQHPELEKEKCYYLTVRMWYFTLADKDLKMTKLCSNKAAQLAKKLFKTELEIIDIIYIPTANVYYYHFDYNDSINTLSEAIKLCDNHKNSIPHLNKKAQLLKCMIDVFLEMENIDKCRQILLEIDNINEITKDEGYFVTFPEEKRAVING